MGIQVIKGVEIGDGFQIVCCCGSCVYDEMYFGFDGVVCFINWVGGLEGGMINGQLLWVCVVMKLIFMVLCVLVIVDLVIGDEVVVIYQCLDVCVVLVVGVVVEIMVVLVLVWVVLEKFGGDLLVEIQCNIVVYQCSVVDCEVLVVWVFG